MTAGFRLGAFGPPADDEHLVAVFFAPCAGLLLDLAGTEPGERVLDVACGTGTVARRASARTGAVVGVEANTAMIEYARGAAAAALPQHRERDGGAGWRAWRWRGRRTAAPGHHPKWTESTVLRAA